MARDNTLVIDYPDFWPFFTRTDDGAMTGFFYEIVSTGLKELDVETKWREFPWKRCQDNVKHGDSDAMITVPTPGRLTYTSTHDTPFYLKKLHVFTSRSNRNIETIKSIETIDDILLKGLTVVTYAGNGWNNQHIKSRNIKVYEAPLIKSIWKMLAEGHGDIAIEWPPAAWASIRESGLSNDTIIETDVTFDPMPFHLLINKNSPHALLLPRFNEVIKEMKENGRIKEIIESYTLNYKH